MKINLNKKIILILSVFIFISNNTNVYAGSIDFNELESISDFKINKSFVSVINDSLFGDDTDIDTSGDDLPSLDDIPETNNNQTSGGTTPPPSGPPPVSTPSPIPYREYGEAVEPDQQIINDAISCIPQAILSNLVTGAIDSAIGSLTSALGLDGQDEVPTKDKSIRTKETGLTIAGFPIIPSWDSFAYCLANQLIAGLADATIYWIRTGFDGNPAFVEDPQRFFAQLSDMHYEIFLNDVVSNLACEPYQDQVFRQLTTSYDSTILDYGKCTLYSGGGDVDGFLNGGKVTYDVWSRYTQNEVNNPIGSAMFFQGEMERYIATQQNSAALELDWGNGFLPWKDMEGNTVSPGSVIESQLEKTLGVSKDRLALADEFDEIVDALIEYLIQWMLDETLGTINTGY